jgi:hypothetical protein
MLNINKRITKKLSNSNSNLFKYVSSSEERGEKAVLRPNGKKRTICIKLNESEKSLKKIRKYTVRIQWKLRHGKWV